MADIPLYDRKVTQDPYPSLGAQLQPGAVETRKPYAQVGDNIQQLLEREARSAERTAFTSLDAQQAGLQAAIQAHVASLEGANAFKAPEIAQKMWDEGIAQIHTDGLSTSAVSGPLKQSADSRKAELLQFVHKHVATEGRKFRDSETAAWMARSRSLVALSPDDPSVFDRELPNQKLLFDSQQEQAGTRLDAEGNETVQYKQAWAENVSGNYRDVIKAALDRDSFVLADAWISRATQEKAITAPDMEKVAYEYHGAEARYRDTVLKAAIDKVERNPGLDPKVSLGKMYDALDPRDKQTVLKWNNAPVEWTRAGRNAYNTLMEKWATDKKALSSMSFGDLEAELAKMPEAAQTEIRGMWKQATTAAQSGQDDLSLTSTLGFKDRVFAVMKSARRIPAKASMATLNDKKAQEVQEMLLKSSQALEEFERDQKRRATAEEKDNIIKKAMNDVVYVPRVGFDQKKPVTDLSPAERAQAYTPIGKIARTDADKIRAALKRAGAKGTDNQVERAYFAFTTGDNALYESIKAER